MHPSPGMPVMMTFFFGQSGSAGHLLRGGSADFESLNPSSIQQPMLQTLFAKAKELPKLHLGGKDYGWVLSF